MAATGEALVAVWDGGSSDGTKDMARPITDGGGGAGGRAPDLPLARDYERLP
jgi:hypothetical protein